MRQSRWQCAVGMIALCVLVGMSSAQTGSPSAAETALQNAARNGQYLFLIFYKEEDAATQAMKTTLDAALARQGGRCQAFTVRVNDPSEKALVARYGLSRAPMPIALAVAPNGAITGGFPLKITEQDVAGAFVSPGMAACLKVTQARKLVLLCVRPAGSTEALPAGINEVKADPQYGPVTEVVTFRADDAAEAGFLKMLELNPKTNVPLTAVLVPPGQRIAVFEGAFTREQFDQQIKASQQGCCPGGKCGPGGCCPGGNCGPN